jgi:transposase
MDNAKYHKSAEVRAAVKKLGIPLIYSGPYSYISAPIELYFGLLKRGDLNPERL